MDSVAQAAQLYAAEAARLYERNPAAVAAAATCAALALASAAWLLCRRRPSRATSSASSAPGAPRRAFAAKRGAHQRSPTPWVAPAGSGKGAVGPGEQLLQQRAAQAPVSAQLAAQAQAAARARAAARRGEEEAAAALLVARVAGPPGGGVAGVCAAPDGGRVAVANDNRNVRLYDAAAAPLGPQARFTNVAVPAGRITGVALGDAGLLAVTVDQPSNIYLYRVGQAVEPCGQIERAHPSVVIRSVAYAPRNVIVTCGEDTSVKLWNTNSAQCLASVNTNQIANYSVAVSPDGNLAAAATAMSELHVYRIARVKGTGEFAGYTRLLSLSGHSGSIESVAFATYEATSPRRFTAPIIITASKDKTVRVWKGLEGWESGGSAFESVVVKLDEAATRVAIAQDASAAVAVCGAALVFINPLTGAVLCSARHQHTGTITGMAWVASKTLIVGSTDRSWSVWRNPAKH
eukprot:m51a1_g11101 hypothetical protein (463) ;mRNA; f:49772-52224